MEGVSWASSTKLPRSSFRSRGAEAPRHEGASYDQSGWRSSRAQLEALRTRSREEGGEKHRDAAGRLPPRIAVRKQKYVDRLMKKAGRDRRRGSRGMPEAARGDRRARAPGAGDGRRRCRDKKLERMIGAAEEFLSVMFIARAAFVLRSVGRIIDRPRQEGLRHRLSRRSERADDERARTRHRRRGRRGARSVPVRARHGLRELGGHLFRLEPERLFLRRPRPRLRARRGRRPSRRTRTPAKRVELAKFGYLPLAGVEGKIHVGQPVNIIQHPGRRAKADRVPREHAQAAAEGKDRHRRPLHR